MYPNFSVKTQINKSPHVVILGAGASLAAFPNGDANGLKLPLMNNLIETVGLEQIINNYGLSYHNKNFETLYSEWVSRNKYPELIRDINTKIETYFGWLRLPPDIATLYDYLVLSLRKGDLIATFNWDPFLGQAYARNINIIGIEHMPDVAYLHGNVMIGVCYQCKTKGWKYNNCMTCNQPFLPSRLLYPVTSKNYTDDKFISSEWKNFEWHLKYSYMTTIFGYSAPITDVAARKLMLDTWTKNEIHESGLFHIIDIKNSDEIKLSWNDFIHRDYYTINNDFFNSHLAIYPRRTCDAYFMAAYQQDPWSTNELPRNVTLKQLQDWILPLIDEEKAGFFSGKKCGFINT